MAGIDRLAYGRFLEKIAAFLQAIGPLWSAPVMNLLARLSCFLFCASILISSARAEPLKLVEDDVVAFLGGTNMVRLQKAGDLETLLSHTFSEAKPKFRDLSWEGDTVDHLSTERERWRTPFNTPRIPP